MLPCRSHASRQRAAGQGARASRDTVDAGARRLRSAFRSGPDAGKKRRMTDRVRALPGSEAETRALLEEGRYVADDALIKTLYLSFGAGPPPAAGRGGRLRQDTSSPRPLPRRWAGGSSACSAMRASTHRPAVYEWNYAAPMLAIRLAERGGTERDALAEDIFGERFLVKRPLLTALEPDPLGPPVLLIDEIDRADAPFEAYPAGGPLRVSGERARDGHGDRCRAAAGRHHLGTARARCMTRSSGAASTIGSATPTPRRRRRSCAPACRGSRNG